MQINPGFGYTFTSSGSGHNLSIEQPWNPIQLYEEEECIPFKIKEVYIATTGGSTVIRYQVCPGTLNNTVPVLDDYVSGTTVKLDRVTSGVANPPTAQIGSTAFDATSKETFIVLRAGVPATGTPNFPDTDVTSSRYPLVVAGNALPADSDTYGYLLIAKITVDNVTTPTVFTVTQYVTGSLWGDRLKLGTLTARYYYARI